MILKRSAKEKLYPNIWQIVTGTLRRGENAFAGSLRELKEETGLKAKRFWVVPHIGTFYDDKNDVIQMSPLFAAEVEEDVEPELSKEHQQYQWVPIDRAVELLVWPGHHDAVRTVHNFIVSGREAGRLTELKLERKKT
jgi:dihydroneopterin triphosphate diphosphatase